MENIILSILVKNESGVLNRVSSLFGRRGFNIDSLSVGETENAAISRMTVTISGGEYEKEQIFKQLEKLEDVISVRILADAETVLRELLLIKVNTPAGKRSEILEAVSIFRAKVVDMNPHSLTVELTGEKNKCNAFIECLKPYGIAEMARTGITALGRGKDILRNETK